jgi:hypothetical protein
MTLPDLSRRHITNGAARLIKMALVLSPLAFTAGCPDSTASKGVTTLTAFTFAPCDRSASPLPGWTGCHASIQLNVGQKSSAGVISVYVNYPDAGSFYHGALNLVGLPSPPGAVSVQLVNDYLSHCVTSFVTTADVYDGTSQNATLMQSIPFTIKATC